MSLAEEQEFWDMCPHRIIVAKVLKRNNEGRPVFDMTTVRTYRCLVDSTSSLSRGLQGESQTVGLNAHVLATPIEKEATDEQVIIGVEEDVTFSTPMISKRPIKSVEEFYDESGKLHNMVIHFS